MDMTKTSPLPGGRSGRLIDIAELMARPTVAPVRRFHRSPSDEPLPVQGEGRECNPESIGDSLALRSGQGREDLVELTALVILGPGADGQADALALFKRWCLACEGHPLMERVRDRFGELLQRRFKPGTQQL